MESGSYTDQHERMDVDYGRRYDELLSEFKNIGGEANIPYEWYDATLKILDEVRWAYDGKAPWIACESLQGIPIALAVADTIEKFWGTEVNRAAVICAFAGHDNGKIDLTYELNQKSHEGEEWLDEDGRAMQAHPVTGAQRAAAYGLPLIITRPIAESHGKQLTPTYGVNPELSPEELHVRNSIAIADAVDAMFDRENTLNNGMSFEDRIEYCKAYIRNACSDYANNGNELAELLIQRVVPQPALAY